MDGFRQKMAKLEPAMKDIAEFREKMPELKLQADKILEVLQGVDLASRSGDYIVDRKRMAEDKPDDIFALCIYLGMVYDLASGAWAKCLEVVGMGKNG